jgi:phytoene synthase
MKASPADLYCRQKAAESGSSFYYSFLFLPPRERQAIQAIYAFCREVDDIVDKGLDRHVAEKKLEWWHTEVARVFLGRPLHPIGRALAEAISQYKLQQHLFQDILEGMEMDLKYQGYQTFEDLRLYCHRVASCVGLLAAEIFGYQDTNTLEYARNLGIAFQLVNIIRDVGEDAGLGRIYLPEDELSQFSVTTKEILNKKYSKNFEVLMQYHAERARSYYQKAKDTLPAIDRYSQRSGLIMGEIYFSLLKEIERSRFQVLHQRIALTPLRKLWIAWTTSRRLKKSDPRAHEK